MISKKLDLASDLKKVESHIQRTPAEDIEVRMGLLRLQEVLRGWLLFARQPKKEAEL